MIFLSKWTLAATVIVGCSIAAIFDGADAHGYLETPRSRNLYAYEEKKWWDVKVTDPEPETDPFSLNIGGTAAQCGMIESRNYDLPKNAKDGGLLQPVIQECYEEGSVIDLHVTLTAYHRGHFDFYACPITWGEAPTEACFKAHPLEFVEDVSYGTPKDENFPQRAYIQWLNKMHYGNFHYKFKLPRDLLGDPVLIQWIYYTGNSCTAEGYADYAFNNGFAYNPEQEKTCALPISGDGSDRDPERFWNCAEVRVTEDCSITTTTTTTPPTVCTPISQEELGYSVTAVSQESCNKCALDNVESTYWPCDSNPPLCDCHRDKTTSTTTTTTQATTTTTTATTTTTTTVQPTSEPTTSKPSPNPTPLPTSAPVTSAPTPLPTLAPTAHPTEAPTEQPTNAPTTSSPTKSPTDQPTSPPTTPIPTQPPTQVPTAEPTKVPTDGPTNNPTTSSPTDAPTTASPSKSPTAQPTNAPTTASPTQPPTAQPTNNPTVPPPTPAPTPPPTNQPTQALSRWHVDEDKCVLGESITEILYSSASACCSARLSWMSNVLCVSRSTGVPTRKFYADQVAGVCRQDCSTGDGLPCGGSPTDLSSTLYSSLDSCCTTSISWESSCVDKSNGDEPQGTGKYYVNWSYGDCVRDCPEGSAPGCGSVKNAWDVAYATLVTCCSTISWKADCGP